MQTRITIDAGDLSEIFSFLKGYNRNTLIPLFNAIHSKILHLVTSMEDADCSSSPYKILIINYDTGRIALTWSFHEEDIDVEDQDEMIWAVSSIEFICEDGDEEFKTKFKQKIMECIKAANLDFEKYKKDAAELLKDEKIYHLSESVQGMYFGK